VVEEQLMDGKTDGVAAAAGRAADGQDWLRKKVRKFCATQETGEEPA